ncbi:hypothetical protein CBW65_03905 [Tumebacillus avium]|uniref:Flavin reductase like domain-containing protein n=1 Tax=Tumebacillus avium TaxID=1903704 RepID=A0A1Y0IIH1_9BACL|nr:flavin reductase family protein [Tumebacillus avium]ARU60301.1 hypothetical protein CBW65_03905 [Tumebacillus avium]
MEKTTLETSKLYYGFPVILVSYYDLNGQPNLATMSSSFSLGNMICLGFGRGGHAVQTIRATLQFSVNVPDRSLMQAIEIGGFTKGSEINKFEMSGLTPTPGITLQVPLIAECPFSLECSVQDIFEHGSYVIVVAEVVQRHVATCLLDSSMRLKNEVLDTILFAGDVHARSYRYLEQDKSDLLGSFLPEQGREIWK